MPTFFFLIFFAGADVAVTLGERVRGLSEPRVIFVPTEYLCLVDPSFPSNP